MKRNLTFVRLITVNALLIFITDWLSPKISFPILSHLRKMRFHLSKTDMKRETMTDFSSTGCQTKLLKPQEKRIQEACPNSRRKKQDQV
jgi:sensor histidine kinase YesM